MFKGVELGAAGFFLVHHSADDRTNSQLRTTLVSNQYHLGATEDLPLIAQVVVTRNQVSFIGGIRSSK
jgi:hypothetical protein